MLVSLGGLYAKALYQRWRCVCVVDDCVVDVL